MQGVDDDSKLDVFKGMVKDDKSKSHETSNSNIVTKVKETKKESTKLKKKKTLIS